MIAIMFLLSIGPWLTTYSVPRGMAREFKSKYLLLLTRFRSRRWNADHYEVGLTLEDHGINLVLAPPANLPSEPQRIHCEVRNGDDRSASNTVHILNIPIRNTRTFYALFPQDFNPIFPKPLPEGRYTVHWTVDGRSKRLGDSFRVGTYGSMKDRPTTLIRRRLSEYQNQ